MFRPRQFDRNGSFGGGGGGAIVPAGGMSGVPISLVEPAVTFTAVTPSSAAAGADTLLTSAGVHGLTAAVSVGANIYISAGTGWTVGFHKITAIAVDTTGTTIQIDTPFDVGMGTPTIALANTEVTMASVLIPPLLANSMIRADATFDSTDTSATSKAIRVKFGTTNYYSTGLTTQPLNRRVTIIHNRGVTNSQVSGLNSGSPAGEGSTAATLTTSSVDTSVPTLLIFTCQCSTPNVLMILQRYIVEVFL